MDDKSGAKWATEAFEFLRLFNRIGQSITGLLFLQIGWTFYMWLMATAVGSTAGRSAIGIPWPTGSALQRYTTIEVRLTTIYVVGSFLIFLIWIFHSRSYKYLSAPIGLIVKPAIIASCTIVIVFLSLVNLPLLLFTWPLERLLVHRWLRRQDPRVLTKIGENGGAERVERVALRKVTIRRWLLVDTSAPLIIKLLSRVLSHGRIGFAPLISHSYIEDLQATKAPLQIFAAAVEQIRIHLQDLQPIPWVRFKTLPPRCQVLTTPRAAFITRLFDLDVLLWGSYLATDAQKIWLNIHQHSSKATRRNIDDGSSDEHMRMYRLQRDLFPNELRINSPALIISQDNALDAYIILVVAVIRVLQQRRAKRGRFSYLDQLSLIPHDILDDLITHLVETLFLNLPPQALTEESIPSAKVLLTEITGQWIGYKLGGFTERVSRRRANLSDLLIQQLAMLAAKCTQLMPRRPEHCYRAGAIACLLGDEQKALGYFKMAGQLDLSQLWGDPDGVLATAKMELRNTNILDSTGYIALSRFSAHAARAIAIGDEFILNSLKEEIDQSDGIKILKEVKPSDRGLIAISVVEKLLEESIARANHGVKGNSL